MHSDAQYLYKQSVDAAFEPFDTLFNESRQRTETNILYM
jgi:hypothetical protein